EFPATKSAIYMDVANQGLISRTTRTSMDQHLDNRLNGLNDEEGMMQLVEQTRSRFAQFIGAEKDEIAVTKNASEGINIIGNAIAWKPGDNVVLCRQLEHANNILPWLQIRDKHGVELRIVETDNGAIPCDAIIDQIDSHSRIVTVSTVTM
ncbi:MAG: aminotransferase class V-fold PLP-dependent enzyme, partial [Mesorhizobium sp.]